MLDIPQPSLGIAIPCYGPHLMWLGACLDSISNSFFSPNQVSISISSIPKELKLNFMELYPFEIKLRVTTSALNAAQNRNLAASMLSTDIISFIDADDLVHPQRNDLLLEAFRLGASAVCHNYSRMKSNFYSFMQTNIDQNIIHPHYIDTISSKAPFPINSVKHLAYHCAHISVSSNIFDQIKFSEDKHFARWEDANFCSKIVRSGYKIDYIDAKLSVYRNNGLE